MRACERGAAEPGVLVEVHRPHLGHVEAALPVAQLAPVVVTTVRVPAPSEERIRGRLHEPLAGDDALPVGAVPAPADEPLEDRRLRLLHLEEERVARPRREERDVAVGRHAADPDHLDGHVHDPEPAEQAPAVALEGAAVSVEPGAHAVDVGEVGPVLDEGRLVDDPRGAVGRVRRDGERVQRVVGERVGDDRLEHARRRAARHRGDLRLVDARVPEVERRHPGEIAGELPIGLDGGPRREQPLRAPVPERPRRDHDARREPLHVPLPRPRQGLVEVVHVEQRSRSGMRRARSSRRARRRRAGPSPRGRRRERSAAMTSAAPRKKANGDPIIRPYRIGKEVRIRVAPCSSRRATGLGGPGPAPTWRGMPAGRGPAAHGQP